MTTKAACVRNQKPSQQKAFKEGSLARRVRLGYRRGAGQNCGFRWARRAEAKAQTRLAVRVRITAVASAKNPKTAAYIDGSGTAVKVKLSNAADVPVVLAAKGPNRSEAEASVIESVIGLGRPPPENVQKYSV